MPNGPNRNKLKHLSRILPRDEELRAIFDDAINDSAERRFDDRHAAIVVSAAVEYGLRLSISRKFIGDREPNLSTDFFDQPNAPGATFSQKIILAYALGVISTRERDELTIIKDVRNQFAHALMFISFSEPAIERACLELFDYPVSDELAYFAPAFGARANFIVACAEYYAKLSDLPRYEQATR